MKDLFKSGLQSLMRKSGHDPWKKLMLKKISQAHILRKQSCRTGAWFFDSLLSFSGSLQCAKDGGGRRGARGQEGQGYRGWCPGGAFTRGPERESHVSEETRLSLVPVSVASEG